MHNPSPSEVLFSTDPIELLVAHLVTRLVYQSSRYLIFESPSQENTSEILDKLKDHEPFATSIADAWYVTVPIKPTV
jgi:hypothetical protein